MDQRTITVSQLTSYLKSLLLKDDNLKNVLVRGEISNFKHHSSGHMYFTLKDEGASLRCVMFKNRNWKLDFRPEDGLDIIAEGFVGVFERAGVYQLYVDRMYTAGKGDLHIAFEQLKAKLQAEGLFAQENKQKLPEYPNNIAVITSSTGAAVRDMAVTISRRYPLAKITLIPARVQGEQAADEISAGLGYANSLDDIDVILVGRGGGSLEEIWPFNTEQVARAIYQSEIPVVSCVGHETDFTISDFVADLRAPTPTAAAELVVPNRDELHRQVIDYQRILTEALYNKKDRMNQKHRELINRPVLKEPQVMVTEREKELNYLEQRLMREMYYFFNKCEQRFSNTVSRLESVSPLKVMRRGFAYCQSEQGEPVKSTDDVAISDKIQLNFYDGIVKCNVIKKEKISRSLPDKVKFSRRGGGS